MTKYPILHLTTRETKKPYIPPPPPPAKYEDAVGWERIEEPEPQEAPQEARDGLSEESGE